MRYPKPEIDMESAMKLWIEEHSDYAKEQVILNNVGIVGFVLKSLNLNPLDEDLFQIGLVGIVKTINTFDPDKGVKFSAYATPIIRNEILMSLRKKRIIPVFSLDEEYRLDNGDSVPMGDMIPSENHFVDLVCSQITLESNIAGMSERKKRILNLSASGKNQYQIAEEMGLSQSYISRILKKIRKDLSK